MGGVDHTVGVASALGGGNAGVQDAPSQLLTLGSVDPPQSLSKSTAWER